MRVTFDFLFKVWNVSLKIGVDLWNRRNCKRLTERWRKLEHIIRTLLFRWNGLPRVQKGGRRRFPRAYISTAPRSCWRGIDTMETAKSFTSRSTNSRRDWPVSYSTRHLWWNQGKLLHPFRSFFVLSCSIPNESFYTELWGSLESKKGGTKNKPTNLRTYRGAWTAALAAGLRSDMRLINPDTQSFHLWTNEMRSSSSPWYF